MDRFLLTIIHFVISVHMAKAAIQQHVFWYNSTFDNTVCTSEQQPVFSQVQSMTRCAAKCSEKDGCSSIFYNEGSCVLSDLLPPTMYEYRCQPFPGYKLYYEGCAPGYEWNEQARTCFRIYQACIGWAESRAVCQSKGADLLVLKDDDFMSFFQTNTLPTVGLQSDCNGLNGLWIGLTDAEQEGIWKWLDGSYLTEGLWDIEEPNGGSAEACAGFLFTFSPTNLFDVPCDFALSLVCGYQIPISGPIASNFLLQ